MNNYRLNINGKEVFGLPGQTILDVAKENDIFIPTLCFDERTKMYGACGICMCEAEGNPKLLKACATEIAPGMVIRTDTKRVIESRKTNLELLLSNHVGDCRPPCVLACPAQTDCQGYVGLIANGAFEEALELVKDKIPLPASLGRVCPHPCEDECRRKLVDEPVSIQMLKRFVGDLDNEKDEIFLPECEEPTGKSVAIIGGGPMGLSTAYFLQQMGHHATIFEAMPKAGGMLRYGIPEYRLPKDVLDLEIEIIQAMGADIVTGTKVGVDIPFETVQADFDAVLLGIGAWLSTGVGCKGEDAKGVIGGIELLRKVERNEPLHIGEKVAVIGGGNTAMDACRTSVRLGAKEVYNIYRRTKDEMPADQIEIIEAEEEGVVFKNLTNPLEIIKDENGHVKQMILQVMKLGEPDASGRKRPVPIEGKTITIDVDTVILAIGQAVNGSLFKVDKTKKGGIVYDPQTFMTSIPGVFAGGDCGNDKISIAVESMADAKKASQIIDAYLSGEAIQYRKPYLVTRDDLTEKDFEDRERTCRPKYDIIEAKDRKGNFIEVVPKGFSPVQAMEESSRCLECGCHDYFECNLVELAAEYDVAPPRIAGDINKIDFEDDHPFIARDPNKCILCGLCVRVCDEVIGVGALGFVNRGFDTVVKPALEKPLTESGCVSCGQCVCVCPTGALQEKTTMEKEVPLNTNVTETTCPYCSVGCSLDLESHGDMLIKANPNKYGVVNAGLCCGKGKWGFDCALAEGMLTQPLIKKTGGFEEVDYYDAFVMVAKKAQALAAKYGNDAVAVAISDRYTNEEAYALKKLAQVMKAKTFCFNHRASGLAPVLGFDASPNTIEELFSTEVLLAIGFDTVSNPVLQLKMKQAAEQGVKVVLINPKGYEQHFDFASKTVYTKNDLSFLKEIAKGLLDAEKKPKTEGAKALAESLKSVKVSKNAAEIVKLYGEAKKAMIAFTQNFVTTEAATLIADIAMISGHIGTPRDGILQIKAKNNSQGLVDLGIRQGVEALEGVKALLIFGEDPIHADLSGLEFLMVSDTHMTQTASKADVVIPATGFAGTDGTYTNTERRMQPVEPAIFDNVDFDNWEIASEIAHVYEVEFSWEDEFDISEEMGDVLPKYKYAELDEIFGGILEPTETAKLVTVGDAKFVDPLPCSDNLMNVINARLPKPVE